MNNYNLGDIFTNDEDYINKINYCIENNYMIKELPERDINGKRQFQIVEMPIQTENETLEILRARRESECFHYINRGILWYNTLTTEQQQELNTWYQAWLNVPQVYLETKPTDIETIIPTKPSWLK